MYIHEQPAQIHKGERKLAKLFGLGLNRQTFVVANKKKKNAQSCTLTHKKNVHMNEICMYIQTSQYITRICTNPYVSAGGKEIPKIICILGSKEYFLD